MSAYERVPDINIFGVAIVCNGNGSGDRIVDQSICSCGCVCDRKLNAALNSFNCNNNALGIFNVVGDDSVTWDINFVCECNFV